MKSFFVMGAILWLLAAFGGVLYLARYENTPAATGIAYPSSFPAASRIEKDDSFPTLIFFAHPKCPCTRASLRELSRLLTDVNGKLKVYTVFDKPPGTPAEWTQTELRAAAEKLPAANVVIDENETETKIFNAQTSGLILLYDQRGKLRYNGGITSARGHEGDNAGRDALFEIINRETEENAAAAVFGCPLHDRECPGELIKDVQ